MKKAIKKSSRITPAAVAAYKAALPLRAHREEQLQADDPDAVCPGRGRCARCDDYEAHVAVVHQALGIKPKDWSPIDVFDAEPPPWFPGTTQASWTRAVEFARQLATAAKRKMPATGNLWELSRAHCNVRWTERNLHIPDGFDVGKPVRLRSWQREVVRQVYSQGDFGAPEMDDGQRARLAKALAGKSAEPAQRTPQRL